MSNEIILYHELGCLCGLLTLNSVWIYGQLRVASYHHKADGILLVRVPAVPTKEFKNLIDYL